MKVKIETEILGSRIVLKLRARCGMRDVGYGMRDENKKIIGYGRHADNLDSNRAG